MKEKVFIHLSDLHFPTEVSWRRLHGKMYSGYFNYRLRRKKKYPPQLWQALIQILTTLDYDGLIISGDLVNIAMEEEFQNARQLLAPILDQRVFLVPGNHDRYSQSAISPEPLLEKYFSDFLGSAIPEVPYLYSKDLAGIRFYGLDSNRPLPFLNASGLLPAEVLSKLSTCIANHDQYFLVCHHPIRDPLTKPESSSHRLLNREQVQQSLQARPPIAYLHGHVHTNWILPPNQHMPFYAINSASSTMLADKKHDTGFHCLRWTDKLAISRYGYHQKQDQFLPIEPVILS